MKTGLEHENKKRTLSKPHGAVSEGRSMECKKDADGLDSERFGTWSCHLLNRASMRSNAGRKRGTSVHHSGCTTERGRLRVR